ncbi:endonuclease/exonuclease/phosphatase family protein [Mycobacterium sp. WMMD1722]|uniref:endonuclease/exonuclease/phosphatase family protein n=1 Tax=Mycobacterium sp. WMMD1722 TaxID=3404117 RepID=UPI003BF56D2B
MTARRIALAAGLAFSAVSAAAIAARYVPITHHAAVVAAAFVPVLSLCAFAALLLSVAARHWPAAVAATGLSVTATAVQMPQYLPAEARTGAVTVRVMTANVHLGQADTEQLARSAEDRADILAVQELTPSAARRLSSRLSPTFPFRVVEARDEAAGAGLWSRYPIRDAQRIPGYRMVMLSGRVHIDDGGTDPTVVVGHMSGPWPQPVADWQADIAQASETMRELARGANGAATVVMGDFNSTLDARPFRALLHNGFRDAAQQAGVGSPPTYPADSAVPPLIAIDHVISRGATAVSLSAVALPGSDHRGLVATLEFDWSPSR